MVWVEAGEGYLAFSIKDPFYRLFGIRDEKFDFYLWKLMMKCADNPGKDIFTGDRTGAYNKFSFNSAGELPHFQNDLPSEVENPFCVFDEYPAGGCQNRFTLCAQEEPGVKLLFK